jgi:Glycosyl hydrolases family 18
VTRRLPSARRRLPLASGAVTLAAAAAVAACLAACSSGTPTASTPAAQPSSPAAAAPQGAGGFEQWPQRVYSPYFETWTNGSIPTIAAQSGVKYFNLGFLQAPSPGSCALTWDGNSSQTADGSSYGAEIGQLKQAGGNVALTLGGQNAGNDGTEIADSCPDVNAIAADYESLIGTYHVTRLDMDVELNALNDTAGIDRRNKAIAMTQAWAASHGHSLQIQYTLPVQPSGLQPNALAVLQNAVSEGAHVDVVNIMTFDYYTGSGPLNMGAAALSAAASVHSQLAALYPKDSQQELWAREGITFLPGIDDNSSKTEVTYFSDAERILDFARSHGLGLLSIWAIERDNGGCPGMIDSNSCSGITQGTWAFSHLLESFTG